MTYASCHFDILIIISLSRAIATPPTFGGGRGGGNGGTPMFGLGYRSHFGGSGLEPTRNVGQRFLVLLFTPHPGPDPRHTEEHVAHRFWGVPQQARRPGWGSGTQQANGQWVGMAEMEAKPVPG